MGHYILSFTVYTMAMCGLIFFALFIYKKVMSGSMGVNKTKTLSVEETMSISPRKTLMIVKAGNERFLIASDVDKTSLISKLNSETTITDVVSDKTSVDNILDLKKEKEQKFERFKKIESNKTEINKTKDVKTQTETETPKKKTPQKSVVNMDVLFPKREKTIISGSVEGSVEDVKDKKTVHLEVIKEKNPASVRKTSSGQRKRRNVSIEVGEVKDHGLSTIKEIVQKVNEI